MFFCLTRRAKERKHATVLTAGWSSPVARQAHNLKAVSSNLAPATKDTKVFEYFRKPFVFGFYAIFSHSIGG